MNIRNICPDDYKVIINVLNEWWGVRQMRNMLPKLFFVHFCQTSFIIERNEEIVGFLIGFRSQTHPQEAYIHFAGVNPSVRKQGVGRALYEKFFETVKKLNCQRVRCVTSPVNKQSIIYHLHMGFKPEASNTLEDNIPYHCDYDGLGEHRVLFLKNL